MIAMMKIPRSAPALLAAVLLLSACGENEPKVVGGNPDTQAAELAAAPPVELPPSVTSSKSYRCGDTVVYVDFLSDGKSANLRTDKAGSPTRAIAPEAGQKMVADGGWSIDGTGDTAQIGTPGHPARSCKS
jgi:hypothetical protein